MSRRKDKTMAGSSDLPLVDPSMSPGQDLLRRALVGFVTALIVARPLVATEDPGLRSPLPDPSGMVLTWLWLVALLGWVVWGFWARQRFVPFGLIDWALLALAGLNLLSAWAGAKFKYAAWYPACLTTWEWVTFFVAFYLVRRMAAWPSAGERLLAALLATGVMLSAYGIYQYVVEIPATAALTPAQLEAGMAREGLTYAPDEFRTSQLMERAQASIVFATFGHPNSFASFIALLLPVAVGWTYAGWRAGGWSGRTELLVACAAVMAVALWLTKSRGAIVATLFVAGIGGVWLGRRLLTLRRMRALLGLVALSLAIGGLAAAGMHETSKGKVAPGESVGLRIGYWNATWKMIREYPWIGVGPGNFGRHYPAYMSEADYEEVQNPHNLLLELWATCGVFGMAILLAALAVFFRRTIQTVTLLRLPGPETAVTAKLSAVGKSPRADPIGQDSLIRYGSSTQWEFYLGGMAGLILGFFLEAWHKPAEELRDWAWIPAVRSLFWFPAFALFASVRWKGLSWTVALTAGVLVLLLNLCISDGISVPAVAIPLWVVVGLVVAQRDVQTGQAGAPAESGGQFAVLRRVLPIPVCAVLVLVYGGTVLLPAMKGADLARQSLRAGEHFTMTFFPRTGFPGATNRSRELIRAVRRNPVQFVEQQIVRPLQLGFEANPDDARYLRPLAKWTAQIWAMTGSDAAREVAWRHALKAQELDPVSHDGWLTEAVLCTTFGRLFQLQAWGPLLAASVPWGPFPNLQLPPQPLGMIVWRYHDPIKSRAAESSRVELDRAASAFAEAVRLAPTQTHIRFQHVMALMAAGHRSQAEREARKLLQIDAKSRHPSRKLPDHFRAEVQRCLEEIQSR